MAQDTPRNRREEFRQLFEMSNIPKPTIKILLYTDAPEWVTKRPVGPFGLGRMIEHLRGHSPAFAHFDPKVESRYVDGSPSANNRLNDLLKREAETGVPFDEIWFFGVHQINKTVPDLGLGGGTPDSELNVDEVTVLGQWMDEHQGGVLVTGDHANERPLDASPEDPNPLCPDTARNEKFLSLGRALGRCIPRGGKLRDWEGDPTSQPGHTANTSVTITGVKPDDPALQHDPLPQRIRHVLFDATGLPAENGQPHPLFFYRDEQPIEFLPDHMHEGSVLLADISDRKIWKKNITTGFRPEPQIVATGIDADRGTRLNLMAAYDGTAVNVGRIVADSSWHHYFNINLEELTFPAQPDSPADQIGQFYSNLGIWLCPSAKRKQMANIMIGWLARQAVVLEEFGPNPTEELAALLGTGGAALRCLKRVASPCEIHELLQMTLSEERRQQAETLYFPEGNKGLSALPSKQLVLGYLVNRFSDESGEPSALAPVSKELREATHAESINVSELAFRRHQSEVTQALRAMERFSPTPD